MLICSSKKVKHQGDAHGMPETLGDLGQRWLSLLATLPSPTHLQVLQLLPACSLIFCSIHTLVYACWVCNVLDLPFYLFWFIVDTYAKGELVDTDAKGEVQIWERAC